MRSEAEIRACLDLCERVPENPVKSGVVCSLAWVLNDPPKDHGPDYSALCDDLKSLCDEQADKIKELTMRCEAQSSSIIQLMNQRDTVSRQLAESRKG